MTTALQSLDAFHESPESQRDVTRAVRVPAGWHFEAAEIVPSGGPSVVLDPNAPRHFNALLSGSGVAFLCRGATSGRLAFRWQTG